MANIYNHFKDSILDKLGSSANVAQFFSCSPTLDLRHSLIRGFEPNHNFASISHATQSLLISAPENSVNIRSFTPDDPKSREFVYGLKTVEDVIQNIDRLAGHGLYTICNETVDIEDGGVSGVAVGNIIEFAPKDTPRSVEKPGTVSIQRDFGVRLLETVYHFRPEIEFERNKRIEFSIHPIRRGYRHEHTIIWEIENVGEANIAVEPTWPNLYSRFIGDKAYGLLIGFLIGLPVPFTTVFSRSIPPFHFGTHTGTKEFWIRTCPSEQTPGKFTTKRGWLDPFKLMCNEDPDGNLISSILSQEGVSALYSGALLSSADGKVLIEGVKGFGDEFMQGEATVDELPDEVRNSVMVTYENASSSLGPVRMEWVYDGETAWVVQLHKGPSPTIGPIIYPGEADTYHRFNVVRGIAELRKLISEIGEGEGIELVGNIGVTSHLGDVLRKARVPSRLVSK